MNLMIKTALVFIKQQLDQYLLNHFVLDESVVILNHLVGQDGAAPQANQNKMVITLINLDHETTVPYYGSQQKKSIAKRTVKTNPPLNFNLDLLFTACFDDYTEALKFLSATIGFFQANLSFNAQRTPALPAAISLLNIEVENTSSAETHNLWNAMGAKYQPSVRFKVRHITFEADQITAITANVTDTQTQAQAQTQVKR